MDDQTPAPFPAPVDLGAGPLPFNVADLTDRSRQIVTERHLRASLARAIILNEDAPSTTVEDAIRDFDAAVVQILQAARLPRSPGVRGPVVDSVGRGWAGRKTPDCRLIIDRQTFMDLPASRRADSLFKTWLHESIHGRKPYADGFAAEWKGYRGFEEGMVEGLARALVVDGLGMRPVLATYNYYVDAYVSLAEATGVSVIELWRRLWHHPAGQVAGAVAPDIMALMAERGLAALTAVQQVRLFAHTRGVFSSANATSRPEALHEHWRRALS